MKIAQYLRRAALIAGPLLLVACATRTQPSDLVPQVKASKSTGQPVAVMAYNGDGVTAVGAAILSQTEGGFKRALETACVQSGLFSSLGGGGYGLEAEVLEVWYPRGFGEVWSKAVVKYSLTRNGSRVWQKMIASEHTVPATRSFAGAERSRQAIIGALKDNIEKAIVGMSGAL